MKKIFLVFLVITFSATGFAQDYRAAGLAFLQVNPDSRLAALGGTGAGLNAGSGQFGPAVHLMNPAARSAENHATVQAGHSLWYAGSGIEYLGITFPADGWQWGVSFTSANIDGFELRDNRATDDPLGEFGAHYLRAGFNANTQLNERWSFGARLDYLYEKIYYDMASGGSISLGTQYKLSDQLYFGAALNHVGAMNKLRHESTPLPTSIRAGVGVFRTIPGIDVDYNVTVDAVKFYQDYAFLAGGYEFVYRKVFSLRGGLQLIDTEITPSFGAGVQWGKILFDYGLTLDQKQLGIPHQFSIHLQL